MPALEPESSKEPELDRMSCKGTTPIFEGSKLAFCFQKIFEKSTTVHQEMHI